MSRIAEQSVLQPAPHLRLLLGSCCFAPDRLFQHDRNKVVVRVELVRVQVAPRDMV
jgi:hypothetical protein